jgi:hypothetical protein
MEGVQIEASDVIKLIQQFLRENQLARTLQALEARTRSAKPLTVCA